MKHIIHHTSKLSNTLLLVGLMLAIVVMAVLVILLQQSSLDISQNLSAALVR